MKKSKTILLSSLTVLMAMSWVAAFSSCSLKDESSSADAVSGTLPAAYHYNRERSVAVPVDESTTSYQLKASFRDDNYYYYMYYLGRLENVPLQDNVTPVRYDGNDLSYTFTSSATTAQTVEKCLSTANTSSTSWSHEDNHSSSNTNMTETTFSFSSTQEADNKLQVGGESLGFLAGTEIKISETNGSSSGSEQSNTINNGYADVWGGSNAETITDSLSNTESYSETVSNSLTVSFNQNYEQGYYRFILLGDIDVFATIVYDVNADEYYYSNIDNVCTKYYALDYSATADFPADSSALSFTFPEISALEIPDAFYGSMELTLCSELDDEQQIVYVPYGSVVDLPVLERDGYVFTGWYDETEKLVTAFTIEKDRRISARWSYKPSQGLSFSLNAGGESYAVSGMGTCTDTTLAIPLSYNGLPVTSIADSALKGKQITSVIIPDNVTTIGVSAFQDCTDLKSIVIGKGVTLINNYAFYNCTALTKIQYNATEAATVGTNESHVAYAGNYIFYDAGLSADGIEVKIGANVTEIPAYLFCPTFLTTSHEPQIVNVIFEEESECKQISIGAFEQCRYLKSINLPTGLEVLGNASLKKCISLQEIVIPESVTTIEMRAFEDCTGLSSITIPDNVTTIGEESFCACTGLKSVTIGKGVETIGNYAFYNCTALTKIQYNATKCTAVGTNEENNPYAGNFIFYCAGLSADGITLTIGANVQRISNYIFSPTVTDNTHGPKIVNVIFEKGSECREIARGAFERCIYLKTINLPNSLETIARYAFKCCNALEEITIPDSVKTIFLNAFESCTGLKTIVIGKNVENMGEYIFQFSNNLQYIYCKAASQPIDWDSNWMNRCNATVYWGGAWEYDENGEPKLKS